MATDAPLFPRLHDELATVFRRQATWYIVRGVLALLFGIAAFLFPGAALFAATLVFAAFSLADGIASIVTGVQGRKAGAIGWGLIVRGLIGVAIGALFLAMPVLATLAYAFTALALLSFWAIVTGIFEIVAAVRLRKEMEGEWLLILSGLLSVLLGLAIPAVLMSDPVATIVSVGWLIGVYALIAGITLLALGIRLRRRVQARAETGQPAAK
jgi:uncharacterized membrane protein HdeD (DUF308 family)